MEPLTSFLVDKGLTVLFDKFSSGFKWAFKSLAERAGLESVREFGSVSEFWHRGVDQLGIRVPAKVRMHGVFSLYAPLVPSHPRSRPGRQVNTWIESRGAADEFSTKNFILWGDGVLVPPVTNSRRAVIGFYDKYGLVGFASIPLIVDLTNQKLRKSFEQLKSKHPVAVEGSVVGRLVSFPYELFDDFNLIPAQRLIPSLRGMPNYVLEVYELTLQEEHPVLYGTQWIGLADKKIFPIYLNLLSREQHREAVVELVKELGKNHESVKAVFDPIPFNIKPGELPILNQYLEEMFKGQ